MALVPPQVNPALRDGVCPRSPGKSWVLAARFPPLYPIPCSEPALAHAPPLLSRRFFCTTWRQGTCRTRWVPQPRAHGGSSRLSDPLNHMWIFIHATPHGKAAFVQGTTEQLCPRDHPITQKTALPLPDGHPFPHPHVEVLPSKLSFSELETTSEVSPLWL